MVIKFCAACVVTSKVLILRVPATAPQWVTITFRWGQEASFNSLSSMPNAQKPTTQITSDTAKHLLSRLNDPGIHFSVHTYVCLLRWCSRARALSQGRKVHFHIEKSGIERDAFMNNLIMQMYGMCGALHDANAAFDMISGKNVFSWTILLSAYAQHGHGKQAIEVFKQMLLDDVVPDIVAFVGIVDACASLRSLAEGKLIHARVVDIGFESGVIVRNALLNMYNKCGCLEEARNTFDGTERLTVVSWSSMIGAYADHGQAREALQLFRSMEIEGAMPNIVTFVNVLDACAIQAALVAGTRFHALARSNGFESDVFVGTALLNMYGKCGNLGDSRKMFDTMPKRSVVSWSNIIAVYAQHGMGMEAVELYQKMVLEGVIPDDITFVNILCACSHAGLIDEGCHCFISFIQGHCIAPRTDHYNIIIDLFGRIGWLGEIGDLINNMSIPANSTTWGTLLGACQMHNDVVRAKIAADHLFELEPDTLTTYVALSNIFSAAGMWNEAAEVRNLMRMRRMRM